MREMCSFSLPFVYSADLISQILEKSIRQRLRLPYSQIELQLLRSQENHHLSCSIYSNYASTTSLPFCIKGWIAQSMLQNIV
jgi:hypothetical protein